MFPFTAIRQIGTKRVRLPSWLVASLQEDHVAARNPAGPVESLVLETTPDLEFTSSAEAERFILSQPVLRRESAFSWWSRNLWIIAINRGGKQFARVRRGAGNQFITDSGEILESVPKRGDFTMRSTDLGVQESVDALLGPSAADSLREKKLDYKKTKAPNFSATHQPGRRRKKKKRKKP